MKTSARQIRHSLVLLAANPEIFACKDFRNRKIKEFPVRQTRFREIRTKDSFYIQETAGADDVAADFAGGLRWMWL